MKIQKIAGIFATLCLCLLFFIGVMNTGLKNSASLQNYQGQPSRQVLKTNDAIHFSHPDLNTSEEHADAVKELQEAEVRFIAPN